MKEYLIDWLIVLFFFLSLPFIFLYFFVKGKSVEQKKTGKGERHR